MPRGATGRTALGASGVLEDPPLRNSCDGCNSAKVRCSKDRPACQRCNSRNIACVYSVSLRGMKRPRPRGENPLYKAHQPNPKKRMTSLPSPLLSDGFLQLDHVALSDPALPFPDWDSLQAGTFSIEDSQDKQLFNVLHTGVPDQLYASCSLPSLLASTPPSSSTRSSSVSYTALAPTTPPTPASPIFPFNNPQTDCSSPSSSQTSLFPSICCCEQKVVKRLADLDTSPSGWPLTLNEFLTEHKVKMAVCTSVFECTDPKHKPSMLLLVKLVALLIHIIVAFDQILHLADSPRVPHAAVPAPCPSQIDYRKEKVSQANVLRAELAKVGALIQELDRRYCILNSTSCTEGLFLLSPLLANLQWKTQEKFDAMRLWAPWL